MKRTDRPSAAVLLSGAFAVVVVLAFVGALAAADTSTQSSGDHLRVVAGPVLQVFRCQDERVRALAVDGAEQTVDPLARRFPLPAGAHEVRVLVGGRTVTATVGPSLPADDGAPRGTPLPCPRQGHLSATTVLFGAGALVVVGGFAVMVVRSVRP